MTIDETQGALYDFASAVCRSGAYDGTVVPRGTTVNAGSQSITLPDVDRSQDLFCTFTNARKTGKLEVRKSLVPSDDPGLLQPSDRRRHRRYRRRRRSWRHDRRAGAAERLILRRGVGGRHDVARGLHELGRVP